MKRKPKSYSDLLKPFRLTVTKNGEVLGSEIVQALSESDAMADHYSLMGSLGLSMFDEEAEVTVEAVTEPISK